MSTLRASQALRNPPNTERTESSPSRRTRTVSVPKLVPVIAYLTVVITNCILFGIALLNPDVQIDLKRWPLAWACFLFMLAAATLGTSWLQFSLPTNARVWISTLTVCGPMIILGLLYNGDALTYNAAVILGAFSAFALSQTVLKVLKVWMHACLPELWAGIVWSVYVVGIYLILLGIPLFNVLTEQLLTFDDIRQLIALCLVTTTLLLVGFWIPVQVTLFRQPKLFTLTSALSIFVLYALSQATTCYLLLQQITEDFQVSVKLILLGVIYCYVPCFTLGGLSWTASQLSKENKQLILVLLCGFMPLPILLPLYFGWTSDYQLVIQYLILILPLTAVYWSLLSILHTIKQDLFKLGAGLSCILVAFPVGVLLPLSELEILDSTAIRVLVYILLGMEVAVIILLTGSRVRLFFKLDRIHKKLAVSNWNFYNGSLCLAMLLFMGAAGLLSWGIGQDPSSWGLGLLIAMLSALPILYILSIVLLKAKVAAERSTNLTDVVDQAMRFDEDAESMDLYTLRKRRIQQLSGCGSCLAFLVLVIALSLQEAVPVLVYTLLLSLSLTVVIFFVAAIIIIQLKYKAASFAKVLMTSTISCCWLFIVLPFVVCIPLALSLSSEDSIGQIVSFAVALAGFLFILGISAFSIVFNLLLKKLEQEKIARAATEHLIDQLKARRVRVDSRHMRVIYDQFKLLGPETYVPKLRDGTFFKMKVLMDLFYAQEIQPADAKEEAPLAPKKEEEEKPRVSCWTCLGCFDTLYQESQADDEFSDREVSKIPSFNVHSMSPKQDDMGNSWLFSAQLSERGFDFESVEVVKLSFKKYTELRVNIECQRLLEDKKTRENWFYLMFRLFARRFEHRGQYMRLVDALEFFRLSGLRAVFVEDQIIHLFQSTSSLRGLTPKLFLRRFLPGLGDLSRFRFEQLVQDFMYPHLVTNLRAAGFRQLDPEVFHSDDSESSEDDVIDAGQYFSPMEPFREKLWGVACYSFIEKKISKCVKFIAKTSSALAKLLFVCVKLTSVKPKAKTRVSPARPVYEGEIKDWNQAVDIIVEGIDTVEKEEGTKKEDVSVARFSGTNLVFVLSRLLEYYSLSAIAFMKGVGWSSSGGGIELISSIVLIETNIVVPAFWVALALSLTFVVLSKWALGRARRGLLGRAEDGSLAKKCSASFWLSRSITLLGSVFYLFIIKSFLNFVACRMEDGSWKMTRNDDMQCFEGIHILYVVAACLGLFAYYPVATLIYPNLQFQSVGLDFKFTSTYLVLVSQVKLIVSGVATFIDYKTQIVFQLVVSGIGIASLAVLSWSMQPCIIKPFNLWNGIGYACSAWNTVAGLTVYYTKSAFLGMAMIGIFYFVAVCIGLVLHYRRFGLFKNRRVSVDRLPKLSHTTIIKAD